MTISEDIFNIYERVWQCLGIWSLPSQTHRQWYTIYRILANFNVMIVFNVCILLSLFVGNSFDDIIETIMVLSGSIPGAIKVLLHIMSRQDVNQLMYLMKLLETISVVSPHEMSILLAAKRKSELVASYFLYSSILVIAVIVLCKVNMRSLLWCSLYPFDWQSNTFWYVAAMIFQVVCTVYIGVITVSLDMWRATAFFILAGFLDVLSGRMQRLGWSNTKNLNKSQIVSVEIKQNHLHEKELIDCVKYHIVCLRYFHVLEKVCKFHYLLQLSISSAFLGVTVYLLTTFHPLEDVPKFAWLGGILCVCSFQLIIPCYLGSIIADKTDQMSFNLYESNWPDMSPWFKSTISIVLEATKEPINMFTGWNLFAISLPTFVSVVKSAYSMVSFLKGVK